MDLSIADGFQTIGAKMAPYDSCLSFHIVQGLGLCNE